MATTFNPTHQAIFQEDTTNYRDAESDPTQEAEVQHYLDEFLQGQEQQDWLTKCDAQETIHHILASMAQPNDIWESYTAGPPFHCSFVAVHNPLYILWRQSHQTIPEMDVTQEGYDAFMRQIVGRDGCYLKQITEASHCIYLCHDQDTDQFHIWGSRQSLVQAIIGLHRRFATWAYHNISRQITFNRYTQIVHTSDDNMPDFQTSRAWHQWFCRTHH